MNPAADFNNSYVGLREDLLKYIKESNCTLLDVGCATGANGKWLFDSGIANYIVGIEHDKEMALEASKQYSRVCNIDLNSKDQLYECIANEEFDYILLGDVLEHLVDPWSTLEVLATTLKPNGTAIISIPNIGHIDTLIHVFIKGYWPYNERGIFDRTHLRFFTLSNIKDLVINSNLEIVSIERKFRHRDAIGSNFPFYGSILRRIFKDLYTFQYIIVCKKKTT